MHIHRNSYLEFKRLESLIHSFERKLDILRDQINNTHDIAISQVYSHDFSKSREPIYITPLKEKQPCVIASGPIRECCHPYVKNRNEYRPRISVEKYQPPGETLKVTVRNGTRFTRGVDRTFLVNRDARKVKVETRGEQPSERRAYTLPKGRRYYRNVPRNKPASREADIGPARTFKARRDPTKATHQESRTTPGSHTFPRRFYYPKERPNVQVNQAIGPFAHFTQGRA